SCRSTRRLNCMMRYLFLRLKNPIHDIPIKSGYRLTNYRSGIVSGAKDGSLIIVELGDFVDIVGKIQGKIIVQVLGGLLLISQHQLHSFIKNISAVDKGGLLYSRISRYRNA